MRYITPRETNRCKDIFIVLSLFQWINVVLFLTCAIYWWIRNIWLVFFLILWEGLLGGAAYVNTFYRVSQEVSYFLYITASWIIISHPAGQKCTFLFHKYCSLKMIDELSLCDILVSKWQMYYHCEPFSKVSVHFIRFICIINADKFLSLHTAGVKFGDVKHSGF